MAAKKKTPTKKFLQPEAKGLGATVCDNIEALRVRAKLTQVQFAEKVGCSVSYASMIAHKRRTPTIETVEIIAKAFDVDPKKLFA
jgi:transcriptional regulator with XRE-family HTH domain